MHYWNTYKLLSFCLLLRVTRQGSHFPGVYCNKFQIWAFGYTYLVHYTVLFHNHGGYYDSRPYIASIRVTSPGVHDGTSAPFSQNFFFGGWGKRVKYNDHDDNKISICMNIVRYCQLFISLFLLVIAIPVFTWTKSRENNMVVTKTEAYII